MAVNNRLLGVQRRLQTGQLTQEDKENLELTRQILTLRREGATILEVARETKQTEPRVRQFMKRGVYRLLCDYLAQLEQGDDAKQTERVVREAKQQFAALAPDALDVYREAFKRNAREDWEEKGMFRSPSDSQWAAERVSKGLGLDQPEHTTRPVIHINIGHMNAEIAAVAADDEEARVAAAKDITPANG